VITSLTDAHVYDEIHVPWGIAITALRPMIMNRLLKKGMSHNNAIGLIYGHVEKYDPMLDQIFIDLINETQGKGIVCILQRNPSLLVGSAQLVRITKVKKDPADHTVAMSILICKAFNADFDGRVLPSLNFSNCGKSLRA
jgi:DNA-directed RNA polymerase beta' subunit